jgi:hypothetical protein
MTAHSELPGTYRVADGSRAIFSDALATWVPLAYDELIATASKYHAVTTYLELSEHIQQVSGIRTRPLLTNWIGKLLEEVLSGSGERRTATDLALRTSGRDDRPRLRGAEDDGRRAPVGTSSSTRPSTGCCANGRTPTTFQPTAASRHSRKPNRTGAHRKPCRHWSADQSARCAY